MPAIGPRPSYSALYREHHARIVSLCRMLLSDQAEAEEVAQEVFVALLVELRTRNRDIAWSPWLSRVAVNMCRTRHRSRWWRWWRDSRDELVESTVRADVATPEQAAVGAEMHARVWEAFRRLSARQREVFAMRQIEGWSNDEVAEMLGLTVGSVKRHLFRAVQHLRKALAEGERPEEA